MELSRLMPTSSSVLTTLTAQHEVLLFVGSFVVLPFAIAYLGPRLRDNVLDFLQPYLKGRSSYLKNNTLNINVEKKEPFISMIAFAIIGLGIFLLLELPSGLDILGFSLALIVAGIYMEIPASAPGIYKNGKYLGTVYKGFIRVGDGLTLGKRQGTETIGSLKILRNGRTVAKLYLTPEGFMELKPDKIHEVFPEIKGKVERFKNLYKMGDYTLQYSFFQKSANASYQEVVNTKSSFDDDTHRRLNDYITNPAYSSLPGNIWYDSFKHH